MTFRRRFLPVLLALILLTVAACSQTPPSTDGVTPSGGGETPTDSKPTPTGGADTNPDISKLTSLEMARFMGYGINLGNTMEACDSGNRIPNREPSVYETMWGQPVTTQAMISGMKAAGFKTLRIPVAWTNAMNFGVNNALDYENWDFTIDEAYLARVEEIINYALNEDMVVIINDHWDHGWWSMFGHEDQAVRDTAMTIFTEMWRQISERYKDYDHRLVFEAANEELGDRFNDKTVFTDQINGKLTTDECYELLTTVAQTFVDTVRPTGGNNADRFLLIPGYNTDIGRTCDDRFKMPTDTADSKLLLSVHYYTPWSYCGDTSGIGGWGTTAEVEEQNELLAMMTKYTDQGYGIVLGEWGVLDNVGSDRYDFFFNFLNNCDKYGYAPMLWDTGGLFDRKQGILFDEDDDAIDKIAKLFRDRSPEARAEITLEEILIAADDNIIWQLKKAANKPQFVFTADEAFAWIMFDDYYLAQYSVGDQYRPESISTGIAATDAEITGEGTYTVALDFTGTELGFASGIGFSAVGLINGEILYPGYFIEITELLINGEPVTFSGKPYTTNDNAVCTRVNLHNPYVSDLPAQARVADGDLTGATWSPLIDYIDMQIETISVTFDYIGTGE